VGWAAPPEVPPTQDTGLPQQSVGGAMARRAQESVHTPRVSQPENLQGQPNGVPLPRRRASRPGPVVEVQGMCHAGYAALLTTAA